MDINNKTKEGVGGDNNESETVPYIPDDELKMPEESFSKIQNVSDDDNWFKTFLIIIILIFLLTCLLGGLYLWYLNLNAATITENGQTTNTQPVDLSNDEKDNSYETTKPTDDVEKPEVLRTIDNEVSTTTNDAEDSTSDQLEDYSEIPEVGPDI